MVRASSDQRVFLRVDWKGLNSILVARGDASVPRISWLDGLMELTAARAGVVAPRTAAGGALVSLEQPSLKRNFTATL